MASRHSCHVVRLESNENRVHGDPLNACAQSQPSIGKGALDACAHGARGGPGAGPDGGKNGAGAGSLNGREPGAGSGGSPGAPGVGPAYGLGFS